jgi:hypothetical protein
MVIKYYFIVFSHEVLHQKYYSFKNHRSCCKVLRKRLLHPSGKGGVTVTGKKTEVSVCEAGPALSEPSTVLARS